MFFIFYFENFLSFGLSEEEALKALKPLIYGNIDNIFENGFLNSLTGTIARGDLETIKKHKASLYKDALCFFYL